MSKAHSLHEPARETPIRRSARVLVVGGGPAGFGAALAAARAGAREVLLVERYGFLGGQATEGFVTALYGFGRQPDVIRGVPLELVERLFAHGAAVSIDRYPTVTIDPEAMKLACIEMLEEAGVELLLHAGAVDALAEDGRVEAVLFESKSGRFAVTGDTVVDATGDADVLTRAGLPFTMIEHANISLVFRVGHVDFNKTHNMYIDQPHVLDRLKKELEGRGMHMGWCRMVNAGELWIDGFMKPLNSLDVDDLTYAEVEGRKHAQTIFRFLREKVCGFENAQLLDTSCQLGVRKSRIVRAEHVQTDKECFEDKPAYADTVVHSSDYDIPYRALVPKGSANLLVAGRSVRVINSIIPAMASGQAAGVAAALAARDGRAVGKVPARALRAELRRQGVNLGGRGLKPAIPPGC